MGRFAELAKEVSSGRELTESDGRELLLAGLEEKTDLLNGAWLLRNSVFASKVSLCSICNAKSGRCTENCIFCAQSVFHHSTSHYYPLLSQETLYEAGDWAAQMKVNRYSIVTAGRGLASADIREVCVAVERLKEEIACCASLGVLPQQSLQALKDAGLTRYHHNLETARSFFPNICTTHSYEDRVQTIVLAKKSGLEVCAGGIFGLGESAEQVVELACFLRELDVDAVPVNFLVPIPGTQAEGYDYLTPWQCLKIIALFRYFLPDKEIVICGGRVDRLGDQHPLVFKAGASGIMTGNYLTVKGRRVEDDLVMLHGLGLEVIDNT